MRFSEERIEKIANDIVDRLAEEELVDLTVEEEELAGLIGDLLLEDLERENIIRREAIEWLTLNRPRLEPGTDAWSIELEKKLEDIAISKAYVLP